MASISQQLPPDATVEDAIERLCFLAKVERGVAQADAGETLTHQAIPSPLHTSGMKCVRSGLFFVDDGVSWVTTIPPRGLVTAITQASASVYGALGSLMP